MSSSSISTTRAPRCETCGAGGAAPRETRTWRYGIIDGWQIVECVSMAMCAGCAATWDQIDRQCARGDAPAAVLPMPLTARMARRQQRQKGLV